MNKTTFELPLTKVLIHKGHGAYGLFTQEFREEFEKIHNISFSEIIHYDPEWDSEMKNKYIESRYDKRLIDIYEKLGPERSLEQFGRKPRNLFIETIPTELINAFHIDAYDGAEWIWCNTSKKYKELLLLLIDNKIDIQGVNEKIEIIKRCEQYLLDNGINFV